MTTPERIAELKVRANTYDEPARVDLLEALAEVERLRGIVEKLTSALTFYAVPGNEASQGNLARCVLAETQPMRPGPSRLMAESAASGQGDDHAKD